MLEIRDLDAGYGRVQVLRRLSLSARAGEIHCLLGRNGAGKTTLLKAIMGLVPTGGGQIRLGGTRLDSLPAWQVPRHGVGYVPQGRRLFADLTVAENLQIGLMAGPRHGAPERLPSDGGEAQPGRARQPPGRNRGDADRLREAALALFPRLRERLGQRAGTLSGGEQQMLATARALCLGPKLLLLDEPTEGLQPSMIALIRKAVLEMKARGVAVLLVEQRVEAVLQIADRVSFIENGRVAASVRPETLHEDPALLHRYVGV